MCASAHAPVHGECGRGGTDKEGPRCREREEKGHAGQQLGDWRSGPARQREREREGEENWHRQVGPSGQRARERGKLPLTCRVRLSGGAGARPGWASCAGLGCFLLFFFSGFSNSFSISFL
jgi:hypothetical protein